MIVIQNKTDNNIGYTQKCIITRFLILLMRLTVLFFITVK